MFKWFKGFCIRMKMVFDEMVWMKMVQMKVGWIKMVFDENGFG